MVREQNFWKILADTLSRELAEAKSEIERLTRERDERESTLASLCDCVNTFAREEGASENHQYLSLSGVKEALSLVVYAQRKKLSTKIEEIELTRGAMAADDERLRKSAARVGIVCGCDAAEEMADEIERLRAALQEIAALVLHV